MSALDGTWLVVWIAVPMIADTCRAKPTMIMSPSFMRSTPSLPDEWSVPPDLGLTQPVGRKLIHCSRVTHTINISGFNSTRLAGLSLENGVRGNYGGEGPLSPVTFSKPRLSAVIGPGLSMP